MDFKGKNVVFVGGLGGIGYETCKQLLTKPIAAINPRCKVHFIQFDITDKSRIQNALETAVAEVKYIDILVNGAGTLSEKNYERMLAINLTGLITTTFEALPYMDKQRSGRGGLIVNIASVMGLEPLSAAAVYSASKHGVIGFTRAISDPYYCDLTGVAVTAICPGLTETPLKNNFFSNYTFDYSKPLVDAFHGVKCQTTANCAAHFLRIIEVNKNGSIWISDEDLREVELKVYWTPTRV